MVVEFVPVSVVGLVASRRNHTVFHTTHDPSATASYIVSTSRSTDPFGPWHCWRLRDRKRGGQQGHGELDGPKQGCIQTIISLDNNLLTT